MSKGNADQKTFWEEFAEVWVTHRSDLDTLMAPVLDGVMARAGLSAGQSVLDIGCGTGTSSIKAASAVGPDGSVVGADISEPMLATARSRGADIGNLEFITSDVAVHDFAAACFDRVISRFGVMFFADSVAAFENVLRAMKPGARLSMACWSNLEVNPWFRAPMYAAKTRLGAPPPVDPDDPGPLAFRDIGRVTGILKSAGFVQVDGVAEPVLLTPSGTLEDVASHASMIGPARRAMDHFEASREDFEAIAEQVARDFEVFVTPEGVRVPAEINYFTAEAPAT